MSTSKAASKPASMASPGPPSAPRKAVGTRSSAVSSKPPAISPSPDYQTPEPLQKSDSQLASLIGAATSQLPLADAAKNGSNTPVAPAAAKRKGRGTTSATPNSEKRSNSSTKPKAKSARSPNETLTDDESGTPEKENNGAPESEDEDGAVGEKGSRLDCSLSRLTKKFLELVQKAPDGILDLNITAEGLQVKKRRLYDITNVMEGIGMLEKTSKNKIQWSRPDNGVGAWDPASVAERLKTLRAEVVQLSTAEEQLEEEVRQVSAKLKKITEEEPDKKYAYVTPEDIRSIPYMATDALISIRAPTGSKLEVADPDEGMEPGKRRYQISLRSSSGPIDVYVVGPKQESPTEPPADPVSLTNAPPIPDTPGSPSGLRLPPPGPSAITSSTDSLDPNSFFNDLGVTDLFLDDSSMLHL